MSRKSKRRSRTRKLGTRSRRIRGMKGGCGTCKTMSGGFRRSRMKGGFVKQDLVNFGRELGYGASSAYRGLLGLNPPTNPSPLVQPIKVK